MIHFTIFGEPVSMKNGREIAVVGPEDDKRTILRKSDGALAYERDALWQIPPWARQRLTGPIRIRLRIWYATERKDLDEALLLDVLQDRWKVVVKGKPRVLIQSGVYRNDNQIKQRFVYWGLDRKNPRTEIWVRPLQAQQQDLLGAPEQPAELAF